jgi:putative PEP-CTERM system TPR-repeat lipoprotein
MSQSGIAVRYTTLKLAVALSLCVPWIASCGSPDTQTLVSKAEAYIGKHEYKAAVIELKNVLVADRDNGRARYLLGVIYSDMEDYDLAETELRRALELNYDRANTTVALGKALFAAGNFAKVLEDVRAEGEMEKPLQAQMFALRARALIGLGRIQEARHSMQQAVDADAQVPEVLLVQATFAASEDHREQAVKLVARAIERDPVNVTAWMMKGDLSRVGNDTEGAKASYRKVIEINPMNVPARLNIALLESAARNFEEARKQVEQARKVAPRNPMAIYMQGLVAFQERKYPAARDSVLQLLKGAPDNLPTLLLAGAVEYALGGYAQAEAYLERVVQRAPQNLYARVLLAQSAGKAGQVDHAIQVLEPGLKQAPRDSKVLALAGDLYMARNDFKTAAQYFAAATKNEPQSAILRTRLGQSRLALGETDRALADLESAAQLDADDYRADVALVISHVNRHQYAEAMKAVQSLEQKQPENPLTYNLKGTVYAGSNDIPEARRQFEHALKLNPTYVPAATNLALLDIRDKNPRAARGRLEAILQKDNGNVQALLSLAQLGPRIGATEKEQVDWLQRAAKANPGLVQPRILLAAYYMRVGNSKNAVEAAEQAQALKPDDSSVLDTLGYAQLAAGQKERALATYSKLAALQPDSPFALNRLAMAQAGNADASAAAVTLRKALAIDRGYIPALISLANLHMQAGRHAEALKVAQQAQKEKPSSGAGYMLEGDVLMAEKKFAQAAKSYETALSKDKNAIIAMKLYGAHMSAGNSGEAQARFAQWLKDSPDDVVVRTYVAERSMQSGEWQRAIGLYEWLQQKNPDNVAVLNNLAWAYQEVGDERALAMAERAYTLHSENAAAADTLGWILLQRGDSARAFKILEKASAAAPKVDGIRLHLAQAAFKSGDKARARQELERLTASGSNIVQQSDARDLLKQLDR